MLRRRSIAFAAVAASVLVACGGSNDDPAADPAGTTPAGAASVTTAPFTTVPSAATPSAATPSATAPVERATPTGPAPATAAPTTPESIVPTTVEVPAALDVRATLLDGSEIELGRYAGRPVLLWFWAPW